MHHSHRTLLIAGCLAACHGSAADGSNVDAGPDAQADDFKGCPEDIPVLMPGLRAAGDHFALQLLAATPEQPERYTDNDWTVEIAARDGTSTADAQIVRGQTFMPIHGHDGRIEPNVQALATPGQFRVDRIDFSMRGPWEVRLWLRSASVDEDYVVFQVCVAK